MGVLWHICSHKHTHEHTCTYTQDTQLLLFFKVDSTKVFGKIFFEKIITYTNFCVYVCIHVSYLCLCVLKCLPLYLEALG